MCLSSPAFMSYTVIITSKRWNYYSNSSQKLELAWLLENFCFFQKNYYLFHPVRGKLIVKSLYTSLHKRDYLCSKLKIPGFLCCRISSSYIQNSFKTSDFRKIFFYRYFIKEYFTKKQLIFGIIRLGIQSTKAQVFPMKYSHRWLYLFCSAP